MIVEGVDIKEEFLNDSEVICKEMNIPVEYLLVWIINSIKLLSDVIKEIHSLDKIGINKWINNTDNILIGHVGVTGMFKVEDKLYKNISHIREFTFNIRIDVNLIRAYIRDHTIDNLLNLNTNES